MPADQEVVTAARDFAKKHGLTVTISSIHDLNATGDSYPSWKDPTALIIFVSAKKDAPEDRPIEWQDGDPEPFRTFGMEFNSLSDAEQYGIWCVNQGATIIGRQIVRPGHEIHRLLFIDHSDRGVLAEGMMRVMQSFGDDD